MSYTQYGPNHSLLNGNGPVIALGRNKEVLLP